MQILDTSHINRFPDDVTIGYAPISDQYSNTILSKKERTEFNNFKNPGRQAEYLTARYLFRHILEVLSYDPEQVRLDKEKGGKPFAKKDHKHLFVSFSHSQELVFCAFSEKLDVGLDTELLNRSIPDRVLDRVLDSSEKAALQHIEPIQIWTLKEAAVKCLGTGLRTNLNDVIISIGEGGEISARFNNDKYIEICSFKATDHQIALAYHSKYI